MGGTYINRYTSSIDLEAVSVHTDSYNESWKYARIRAMKERAEAIERKEAQYKRDLERVQIEEIKEMSL